MPTTAKKTATSTPRKRAAAVDSAADPEEGAEAPDKVATHDVIRPIVIAGTQHAPGDGVTLSGLDAAVLYNEGYVRRH